MKAFLDATVAKLEVLTSLWSCYWVGAWYWTVTYGGKHWRPITMHACCSWKGNGVSPWRHGSRCSRWRYWCRKTRRGTGGSNPGGGILGSHEEIIGHSRSYDCNIGMEKARKIKIHIQNYNLFSRNNKIDIILCFLVMQADSTLVHTIRILIFSERISTIRNTRHRRRYRRWQWRVVICNKIRTSQYWK